MRILFVRTDHGLAGLGSRLIRAFEGGLASHCGTILADGTVVDTTWPHGARRLSYGDFMAGRTLVADLDVSVPDEAAAEAWLIAQVGRPYDLLDILSFLAWRDLGRRDRYVCSGQTLRALLHGGLRLLERPDRWGVRHMLILADGLARGQLGSRTKL